MQRSQDLLKQSGHAVADVWTDVRSFDLDWILPYRTAFSARLITSPTTWMSLLFGFVPLVGGFFIGDENQLLAWLVMYSGAAWTVYFYLVVAKRASSLVLGLAAGVFTILIGYPLLLMTRPIPPLSWMYDAITPQESVGRFIGYVLAVGPHEELVKALPVLVLAFGLRRVSKPMDGLFYGALSGVALAGREAQQYIAQMNNINAVLYQALLRSTTLPFLHATWTGIAGYFIGLAVVSRTRRAGLCVLGIAIAAVLHGVFDFASERVASVAIAAFVYLLFTSYIDRSNEMVRGLAGVNMPDSAPCAVEPAAG
jgi:RsiW-degrading membrane proteinase PrsW (M82 family)